MARIDPRARLEALEAVFAALAHPARRQILLAVHFRGGSMTAGGIAGRFAHAWPTTTRHLRVLEEAGLLHHEKLGRSRVYRIDRTRLGVVEEWLAWFGERTNNKKGTGKPGPAPRARLRKEGGPWRRTPR